MILATITASLLVCFLSLFENQIVKFFIKNGFVLVVDELESGWNAFYFFVFFSTTMSVASSFIRASHK